MPGKTNETALTAYLTAYALTVAAMVAASFFPEMRVWGLSVWGYIPRGVLIGSLLPLVLAVPAAKRLSRHEASEQARVSYVLLSLLIVAAAAVLFILLRTRTHFLGDGYTLLSLLARDEPLVKARQIGEALVHVRIKDLTGRPGESGALLSFRIISISSGVLFAAAAFGFARKLFARNRQRVLFALGLITGGYSLLFFGYVENYSLFVLSVGLFTLTGLAAAGGSLGRWWVVVPLVAAGFFHGLGIVLLPAAAYVLFSGTRAADRMDGTSRRIRLLVVVAVLFLGFAALQYARSESFFLRLAFLPLVEGRFTVDGYTLFSVAHLLDFINLLFILLPGLALAGVAVFRSPWQRLAASPPYRFLLVLIASCLAAAFFLDPKLGMARDWDLFAFTGVPLAAGFYFLILNDHASRHGTAVGVMAIVLGLVWVSGRVVATNDPGIGAQRYESYLQLAPGRSRTAYLSLVNFWEERGDAAQSDRVRSAWDSRYPERRIIRQARQALNNGQRSEAKVLFERVLHRNPLYADAWVGLGAVYEGDGYIDSARICYDVARGVNPHLATAWIHLGKMHQREGDYARSEAHLLRALEIDPESAQAEYYLYQLYRENGELEKAIGYLERAVTRPTAGIGLFDELGRLYLSAGQTSGAVRMYRRALEKGMDTSYVQGLAERFPVLYMLVPEPDRGEED